MNSVDSKIIGQSKPAVELKKMIGLVASSNSPVIINGPTGSGKELVAEAIHDESRRKGNFIALNCAAIPSELMEAEIFGFEKGAFTGALKTTIGKFEQADKGTLFLDEIGDMPFGLQTKLLRVIENSVISRVGSNKEIKLDVRIICATHKDLNELVETNVFREDLLFRLNVFPVSVPSLKNRASDIPDLVQHFLNIKTRADKRKRPHFQDTALEALKSYDWPGNIREVRNVIERSLIFFPNQPETIGVCQSKDKGDDGYHARKRVDRRDFTASPRFRVGNDCPFCQYNSYFQRRGSMYTHTYGGRKDYTCLERALSQSSSLLCKRFNRKGKAKHICMEYEERYREPVIFHTARSRH